MNLNQFQTLVNALGETTMTDSLRLVQHGGNWHSDSAFSDQQIRTTFTNAGFDPNIRIGQVWSRPMDNPGV